MLQTLLALSASLETEQQPLADLVITPLAVIDATGAPALAQMTVVIRKGRIAEIGKSGDVAIPSGARIVDASGKFLIPGLWDMHGHLTEAGEGALALLMENGVTGVRDMGGDLEKIDLWRRQIATGERLGPHIVRAGPFVDGPKPHLKNRVAVTTAIEARRAVAGLKRRGVDFIKGLVFNGKRRGAWILQGTEPRLSVLCHRAICKVVSTEMNAREDA
jgi:predicted amidohydrolase YtcJ